MKRAEHRTKGQGPGAARKVVRLGYLSLALSPLAVVLCLGAGLWAQNSGKGSNTGGKPPQGVGDIELVEKVLATRKAYQHALEKLRLHYLDTNDVERARWAEDELKQYHRIAKQAYRLDLDVPPPTLQGTENIPAANKLYQRAMTYKDKGWNWDYIDNQRRAEILLQRILSQYPQCDKIGDVAYQLGSLYESKAYRQYRRAALYYERCFQWHGHTHFDARIRAARLYDKQLLDRGRAIELYREVKNKETEPSWIQEAEKRLNELSGSR
jgi:tetratricopeptide (TPR) repeat protein